MSSHTKVTSKHTKLNYYGFIIILMALSFIGCSTTAGIEGSLSATTGQDGQTVYRKNVIIHNDSLARNIQLVDMKSDFVGNLLRAHVFLLNKDNDTLNLQFKFSWFDEGGRELDPDTDAWTPVILYGNESKSLQGVAPNPNAKEFKIKIRELHND
ncbi:MAG: DUF1425 domain-containing protein [Candidatus Brocadia sp.]|nr:DUF1425 domain-containing protein [Candidatus Brocadia sp.]